MTKEKALVEARRRWADSGHVEKDPVTHAYNVGVWNYSRGTFDIRGSSLCGWADAFRDIARRCEEAEARWPRFY